MRKKRAPHLKLKEEAGGCEDVGKDLVELARDSGGDSSRIGAAVVVVEEWLGGGSRTNNYGGGRRAVDDMGWG
jgi:hypothetical protein